MDCKYSRLKPHSQPDPGIVSGQRVRAIREGFAYVRTNRLLRSTFVIDEKGKIAHIFRKVKPEGHAAQVLEALAGK